MNEAALQNNPVLDMAAMLQAAGRPSFNGVRAWENTLCALMMALEPKSRAYRLLEALPAHINPLDGVDVLNTLSNLGYVARSVPMQNALIDPRLLPCLFVTDEGMPQVILGRDGDTMVIWHDGLIDKTDMAALAATSGTAWLFSRFDESRPATSKFMREGSGHSWFRAVFGRFRGTLLIVLGAGFVLNLVALGTPIFIMAVYDRVIAAGSLATLPMFAVGAAAAIVLEWSFRHIRSKALSWLAARLDNIVGNAIFARLIGLSPDMIERASVAAQIARIKTFESVRDFFSGSVFLSVIEMPFVIMAAIAIAAIAGNLVLVPLLMAGAFMLLFWFVIQQVRVAIRLAAKASSARQQFAIETFEKIRSVRCAGLTDIWHAKFRDLSGREMMAHFHLNWLGTVAETLSNALIILSAVLTATVGVNMIWAGSMTTGALVATMILVWRVLMPFYSLSSMVPRLEQLRNSILQVNKLMDLDSEAAQSGIAARLPSLRGSLNFQRACAAYDENDPVFSELTLDVRPGDLVVITGDNGAGKTTLLKLVKRMHALRHGTVQIDGFDSRQLDPSSLRRQIAYVPQQPSFFKGSILDNLRIGNPLATREEAQAALQMADAWHDIMTMPEGLDSVIGRHSTISPENNLACRLALARGYLHDSTILLIDELPNSLLCGTAGKQLREYLVRCKGKRTVMMINYREDFMRMADTVVLLQRGKAPVVGPAPAVLETLRQREAA